MKRLCVIAIAALASAQALAVGNLADVSVTDRDTGETLSVYRHRGDYWVAGRPGARYAIRIRNQRQRAIDGRDVRRRSQCHHG